MISRVLLASTIAFTGVAVSAPSAEAQVQLHELLFNRKKREEYRKQRELRRQPQVTQPRKEKKVVRTAPKPQRPAIRKVSGPQYYTYKAPTIAGVALSSLVATPASADPLAAPVMDFEARRFAEAVPMLADTNFAIEQEIAEAVKAHYKDNPAFIWSRGTGVTEDAKAVAALLSAADKHGLNSGDYAVALPDEGYSLDNPAARARELIVFELEMTARAIRYAMDMKDGMINPNKLSGYHDFSRPRLTADEALRKLAKPGEAASWLTRQEPQQPHYKTLMAELQALKGQTDNAIVLPEKLLLKPGTENEALPLVMKAVDRKLREETRAKHAGTLATYDGVSTVYDDKLVDLMRDVQRDLGLKPDGIIGPMTASRLGGESLQSKVDRVVMAMERLRWFNEKYGARQVVINQPEYRVRYMEGNVTALAMNVVVGTKANQTYFFQDEIETVVFNPYWGVPQSIIVNEMLPRLHRDPGYLDRAGYVVTTAGGKKVSSSSVNWGKYAGPVPFNVRQKPGPSNALGELKILFPNKHAIYMHDTPAKNLFSRENRAYSHGCVRLEDPRAMAAAVLGKDKAYVAAKLNETGYELGVSLERKVPIYIGYFTAWPDDDGTVKYFPDVYERDEHLKKALDTVHAARSEAS